MINLIHNQMWVIEGIFLLVHGHAISDGRH